MCPTNGSTQALSGGLGAPDLFGAFNALRGAPGGGPLPSPNLPGSFNAIPLAPPDIAGSFNAMPLPGASPSAGFGAFPTPIPGGPMAFNPVRRAVTSPLDPAVLRPAPFARPPFQGAPEQGSMSGTVPPPPRGFQGAPEQGSPAAGLSSFGMAQPAGLPALRPGMALPMSYAGQGFDGPAEYGSPGGTVPASRPFGGMAEQGSPGGFSPRTPPSVGMAQAPNLPGLRPGMALPVSYTGQGFDAPAEQGSPGGFVAPIARAPFPDAQGFGDHAPLTQNDPGFPPLPDYPSQVPDDLRAPVARPMARVAPVARPPRQMIAPAPVARPPEAPGTGGVARPAAVPDSYRGLRVANDDRDGRYIATGGENISLGDILGMALSAPGTRR